MKAMTQIGMRERSLFPYFYKGFHLLRTHGRVYGFPRFLDPEEMLTTGQLFTHSAVRSATTLEELEQLLDGLDPRSFEPELVGTCEGYNLLRYGGAVYGVPGSLGLVDLGADEERRRPGVIRGESVEEVQGGIRRLSAAAPVEFAGWLPIYEVSGNCGKHPQFKHVSAPPDGYRFTCSIPRRKPEPRWRKRWRSFTRAVGRAAAATTLVLRPFLALFRGAGASPRARLRVLAALFRLFLALRRNGARLLPSLRFLQSRHFGSQLLLGDRPGLVFLTSMPYTYGQNSWVIEIEDPTTLFYPLIQNGRTCDLRPAESPWLPIVRTLLEADECKGVITHMKSTARLVPALFKSEKIRNKVHYAPLGVRAPARWQRHDEEDPEHLELVFINSWCQVPSNFYLRGGLDVLEAFATLKERYPQMRLTLRTELPTLADHYHRILESGWVRVISRFLSAEEMSSLLATSHIFLLPAARVHILSLLQAMSYGLAVVASDGWGIEEYLEHERNGLIVKGRYGKTSWEDPEAGLLREDYEHTYTPDPVVVEGIVEAASRLVEDGALRRRLGRTARRDVETTFTLENWNRGLKEAFDKALPAPAPAPERGVLAS
jgi:glycosyltransferase involved in cell wall biosynthesis